MNVNKLISLLILVMLVVACSEKQKISEDNLNAKQSKITTEYATTKPTPEKLAASKLPKHDPIIIRFDGFGPS